MKTLTLEGARDLYRKWHNGEEPTEEYYIKVFMVKTKRLRALRDAGYAVLAIGFLAAVTAWFVLLSRAVSP